MQPTSGPDASKLSEQQLKDIYPTPKTYDEKLAERAEAHAMLQARYTRHPRWVIATIILAFIAGLLLIAAAALSLMLTSPMLGVPLVMLLSVAWYFGVRTSITTIRTILDTNPHL